MPSTGPNTQSQTSHLIRLHQLKNIQSAPINTQASPQSASNQPNELSRGKQFPFQLLNTSQPCCIRYKKNVIYPNPKPSRLSTKNFSNSNWNMNKGSITLKQELKILFLKKLSLGSGIKGMYAWKCTGNDMNSWPCKIKSPVSPFHHLRSQKFNLHKAHCPPLQAYHPKIISHCKLYKVECHKKFRNQLNQDNKKVKTQRKIKLNKKRNRSHQQWQKKSCKTLFGQASKKGSGQWQSVLHNFIEWNP